MSLSRKLGRLVVVAMVLGLGQSVAQPNSRAAVRVATGSYLAAGVSRSITLWRQEIAKPDDASILNFFRKNPGQTAFPNVAFFIVVSDSTNLDEGKIVWATYVYNNWAVLPRESWMAEFARPVQDSRVSVVLLRSIGWDVQCSVYLADLNGELGRFPVRLDIANYPAWPAAGAAYSVYKKALLGRDIVGVSDIRVDAAGDKVVIHAKREVPTAPDMSFSFEVGSKKWSEVSEPVEKRN